MLNKKTRFYYIPAPSTPSDIGWTMDIGLRIYGQVIVIVERRHSVLEMSESGPEIAVRGEESAPAQACPGRPSPASTHPCPKSSPCVLLPWRGLGGPYAKWAVTRVMGVRWRGPARRATGHKITTSPHQHRPATQHRTDQIFFLSEAKIYLNSLNKIFSELILSSRTNF